MSDEWITVGRNNKPLRGSKGNMQPINRPQERCQRRQGPKEHFKLLKTPPGPSKKGLLLTIPAELRIKIWEYCLPSDQIINVSLYHTLPIHISTDNFSYRNLDRSPVEKIGSAAPNVDTTRRFYPSIDRYTKRRQRYYTVATSLSKSTVAIGYNTNLYGYSARYLRKKKDAILNCRGCSPSIEPSILPSASMPTSTATQITCSIT